MVIYVVRPGDSIYKIAMQFGISASKIISDNELANPGRLVVGQTIVIIGNGRHVVAPGESLYSIAQRYRVELTRLRSVNPQVPANGLIYPGQVLVIPYETPRLRTIDVNGYAFPGTSMAVLRKTFPYLTFLSIFSYQVKSDGTLTDIPDTPLIQAARSVRVAPLMVITNMKESGGFDSDLAHTILSGGQLQDKLINNILARMKAKDYYGLNIDFEYIYPGDRDLYNSFLRKVTSRLQPSGYIVTTSLAPKNSADQSGLLYEAHDYPVHGALANYVVLMTYEWGYTYGPPMAVSPINDVRRVLDYAVTAIPRYKILMGVPNYGYDWTLPYRPGTSARTVTNTGAVDLAASVGAVIRYDPVSQAPFFNYYDSQGREHVVWFEDARSINSKLLLINEYRLAGPSYWTIGSYFPQNWLVLSSLYNVRKLLQA